MNPQDFPRFWAAFRCGLLWSRISNLHLQAWLIHNPELARQTREQFLELASLARELTSAADEQERIFGALVRLAHQVEDGLISEHAAELSLQYESVLNSQEGAAGAIEAAVEDLRVSRIASSLVQRDASESPRLLSDASELPRVLTDALTGELRRFFELGGFTGRLQRPTVRELGERMPERSPRGEWQFANVVENVDGPLEQPRRIEFERRWSELSVPPLIGNLEMIDTRAELSRLLEEAVRRVLRVEASAEEADREIIPSTDDWSCERGDGRIELRYQGLVIFSLVDGIREANLLVALFRAENRQIPISRLRQQWRQLNIGDADRVAESTVRNVLASLRSMFREDSERPPQQVRFDRPAVDKILPGVRSKEPVRLVLEPLHDQFAADATTRV